MKRKRKKTRKGRVVHVSHENWFAALLEDDLRLADFLRHHLPSRMVAQLADSPPIRLSERHLTPELRKLVSDFVYLLPLKEGNGYPELVVNLEHHSSVFPAMARRTSVYESLLRFRLAGDDPKADPPVVVLIAYHGKRRWRAKRSLEERIVATGAIRDAQATHTYLLSDMFRMEEGALAEDPVLRAGLLLSTSMYRKGVTAKVIARLLEPFPAGSRLEELAIRYSMGLDVRRKVLRKGIEKAKSRRGVRMMRGFLRRFHEKAVRKGEAKGEARGEARGEAKGVARGVAKGKEEERVRMLLLLLKGRYGELPAMVVAQVKAATPEQLDKWATDLVHPERADRLFRGFGGNGRAPAN